MKGHKNPRAQKGVSQEIPINCKTYINADSFISRELLIPFL